MFKNVLIIAAALALCAPGASAQEKTPAGACAADIKAKCAGVERGQGRIAACVKEHLNDLSPACQAKIAALAAGSKACRTDVKEHCADVRRGRGRIRECLRSALANLSDACKESISKAIARRRSL